MTGDPSVAAKTPDSAETLLEMVWTLAVIASTRSSSRFTCTTELVTSPSSGTVWSVTPVTSLLVSPTTLPSFTSTYAMKQTRTAQNTATMSPATSPPDRPPLAKV